MENLYCLAGFLVIMFDICPDTQQAVVSALNSHHLQDQRLILCHSPGEIQSNGYCSLGTHDLFRELIEDRRDPFDRQYYAQVTDSWFLLRSSSILSREM